MTNYYEITLPTAEYPVTLEEVKEWLKLEPSFTADDALLNSLIAAATDMAERYTNRVFIERGISGYIDNIGNSGYNNACFIQLDRAPVSLIDGVFEWLEGAADYSAYTNYELKVSDGFPRLMLYDGINSLEDEKAYPMRVDFTAGYGDASEVPEGIKTAIKSLIDMIYFNRGDCCPDGNLDDLPRNIKLLLGQYRLLSAFTAGS